MGKAFNLKASIRQCLLFSASSVMLELSEFGIHLLRITALYNVTARLIAEAIQSKSLLWEVR